MAAVKVTELLIRQIKKVTLTKKICNVKSLKRSKKERIFRITATIKLGIVMILNIKKAKTILGYT